MVRRIASASVLAATVAGAVLSLAGAAGAETGRPNLHPAAASSVPDGSTYTPHGSGRSVDSADPDTDYPGTEN